MALGTVNTYKNSSRSSDRASKIKGSGFRIFRSKCCFMQIVSLLFLSVVDWDLSSLFFYYYIVIMMIAQRDACAHIKIHGAREHARDFRFEELWCDINYKLLIRIFCFFFFRHHGRPAATKLCQQITPRSPQKPINNRGLNVTNEDVTQLTRRN